MSRPEARRAIPRASYGEQPLLGSSGKCHHGQESAECKLKGKRISQNPGGQNQQVGKSGGVHFKPPASTTQPL